MWEDYENNAEREEREAALLGLSVHETAPEDIDEEEHIPCTCGQKLCGECMRY